MNLAILFGGVSFEHEISIVSAISVKKVLNFEPKFIFCDDEHRFYLIPSKDMKAKFFSSYDYKKETELFLGHGGFYAKNFFGTKQVFDGTVLNLIHGADGEDGTIASLLDFYNISYIGSRVEASVLSYSKLLTKHLASLAGVKSLEYQVITRDEQDIKLPYPFIVKPLRAGSSLGISVVSCKDELEYALDMAYEYDDTLLVEPFMDGIKEYNQAGFLGKDGFVFSLIEEPKKEKLLDFDKKYKDFSRTQKVLEADMDEDLREKIQNAFKKIYDPLFKGAMIRCDFFVRYGEVYLNEVNPNPGSMANYLYDDFDLALKQMVQNLPKKQEIKVDYSFIHEINSAKGKA